MSTISQYRELKLSQGTGITVGRASTRDPLRAASGDNLWFFNSQLSKFHANLENKGGRLFINDEQSSFGTVLNNKVLQPYVSFEIKNGDILSFIMVKSYGSIKKIIESSEERMIDLQTFGSPRLMMSFNIEVENINDDLIIKFDPLDVPSTISLDSEDETYEIEGFKSDAEPQETVEKTDIYTLLEPISSDSEQDGTYVFSDSDDSDQFSEDEEETDDLLEFKNTNKKSGNLDKDFELQKSNALEEYLTSIQRTDPTLIVQEDNREEDSEESDQDDYDYDEESEQEEFVDNGNEVEYVCYDDDCASYGGCQCDDESDYDVEDDALLADYIYSKSQWMEKPPSKAKTFLKEFGKAIGYSLLTIIALGIYGGYSEANSS